MRRSVGHAGVTDAEAQRFLVGLGRESRHDLERVLAPFSAQLESAYVHLIRGDPRGVIAEFATSHSIDVLVMGTVARSGVAGRIVGNTAEAVVSQMPCSMLVVKPDEWGTRRRRSTHKSVGRHSKGV